MSIRNRQQLENTRKKIVLLEERCRVIEAEPQPSESKFAGEMSLRSLKKIINQMKEEVARFETRASVGAEQAGA